MLECSKARLLRRRAKQVDEFRHELQALPVLRLLFQKFEAVAQSVARPSRLVRALDGRLAVELELAGHRTSREKGVSITYRGMTRTNRGARPSACGNDTGGIDPDSRLHKGKPIIFPPFLFAVPNHTLCLV